MSDKEIKLPPLPGERTGKSSWSAEEVRDYARAAVEWPGSYDAKGNPLGPHDNKADVTVPPPDSMRAYRVLRVAVEAMMAPLGYHGAISARDDRAQAVMDALAQIDDIENNGTPLKWSAILESLRDKEKGGPL